MTESAILAGKASEARALLVALLRDAAKLEHCLLNSYLYAACALKSTPQEFEDVAGGKNRRRAIQFERARAWKQSILNVAHEEMLHLHYVQCMLRALGEPPCFDLPARNDDGNWIIPNWQAQVGGQVIDGVEIPIAPPGLETISRFVLYEASDSLQDADPFGPEISALIERLYQLELDLHFEGVLLRVTDASRRHELKESLIKLYTTLAPLSAQVAPETLVAEPEGLPKAEEVKFQSIADFYTKGISPLYEQAFDFGWVTHSNLNLNDELLDPNYAAEGFLPIGPIYRDKNFESFSEENRDDPFRDYMHVSDIIKEIVEEGEGQAQFEANAVRLLDKVAELGGAREYLQAVLSDRGSQEPTPEWLKEGELLRHSHLYLFAMVMAEMKYEKRLSNSCGVAFDPVRDIVDVDGDVGLSKLADELPAQFNSCYLVLLAWLARIYEIRDWMADAPRRKTIEMLASWPLMSMAIRPFLELASLLPVQREQLFRLDSASLPVIPVHAQELWRLYASGQRSEDLNVQMDYLAVRVLADTADWASSKLAAVTEADLTGNAGELIASRLAQLSELDEFKKQFPYRVHGGYSNRLPDLTYQHSQEGKPDYEEDPSQLAALYQDALVLRLRFAGWGLVQMATDPDPPKDEVGCSGTLMFHPADGDRRFNRAIVWQNTDSETTILREPRAELPALGVNCIEASLLVADGVATAGYVPLQVLQSTGAVQTSGVQQDLQVRGLREVLTLGRQDILEDPLQLRVDLLEKNGTKPFLNGLNHLVWQDGEPIDPFIVAVLADSDPAGDDGGQADRLFQREIFNDGLSLLEMSPIQRLRTARQPCGFDTDLSNIPSWARRGLSQRQRRLLEGPGYPRSYLNARSEVLVDDLAMQLKDAGESQEHVDAVVSLAERLALVSVPRGTTVGWLRILLHYGHTVSGDLHVDRSDDPILATFENRTQLALRLGGGQLRDEPNQRWLVKYTKGIMDTDALSDFVFGELYLPLVVDASKKPVALDFSWRFSASIREEVANYACRFDHPFWAPYKVDGDVRRLTLPNNWALVETVEGSSEPTSYRYRTTGIPGVQSYVASFTLSEPDSAGEVTLIWCVEFEGDETAVVAVVSFISASASAMTSAMQAHFGPHPTFVS